jgi:hypothetical protein
MLPYTDGFILLVIDKADFPSLISYFRLMLLPMTCCGGMP